MPGSETFHVKLIENRPVPGDVGMLVILPVEGRINDNTFRYERGAIAFISPQVLFWVPEIPKKSVIPLDGSVDGFGVRIEQ